MIDTVSYSPQYLDDDRIDVDSARAHEGAQGSDGRWQQPDGLHGCRWPWTPRSNEARWPVDREVSRAGGRGGNGRGFKRGDDASARLSSETSTANRRGTRVKRCDVSLLSFGAKSTTGSVSGGKMQL